MLAALNLFSYCYCLARKNSAVASENETFCGLVAFTSMYGPATVVAFCRVPVKVIVIPVAVRVTLIVGTTSIPGAMLVESHKGKPYEASTNVLLESCPQIYIDAGCAHLQLVRGRLYWP